MIIHRVWSENVLKYATLELHDLPAHGLIGVSGANESGKSSIGETICFALFGRTFAYKEREIVHVIRWGESSCAASLDFSLDDQHYTVSRFLDAQGNHGARLSDHDDKPLARGVEPVRDALVALLGFGFDEFVESFYLAQREITTPHPHSMAVKKMAGIAALEQVAAEATAEIGQAHTAISDTERAIAEVEQRIAELHVDASLLPSLESKRQNLCALQDQDAAHVTSLQTETTRYQTWGENLHTAVDTFCEATIDTPYQVWQTCVEQFATRLATLASQDQDAAILTSAREELHDFARDATQRLSEIDRLRHSAQTYRQHLASLLGEQPVAPDRSRPTVEPWRARKTRYRTQIHAITSRRTTTRIGLYVFLGLALIVWTAWGVITQAPESSIAQSISNVLASTSGGWAHIDDKAWLLPTAAILSLLFALCVARSLALGSKIAQLQRSCDDIDQHIAHVRQQANTLDTLDTMPLAQAVSVLATCDNQDVTTAVRLFQQSAGAEWIDAVKLDQYHTRLHRLRDQMASQVITQCQALATQIDAIQAAMASRQDTMDQLDQHIANEQARHQRLHECKVAIANHQDHITTQHRRVQVRELACDLLAHGAQHIAKIFNRDIRGLVSRTLPLLTQGRYEHLKIDENLDVQVFSSGKRDFMQLEEISTGTQRQIMLAVRLALSQEFINTTLGRHQFLFLDEPFAFFDDARTRSALQALPQLSPELRQIWIVAQSFPQDFAFDLHICCRQDTDRLTLGKG